MENIEKLNTAVKISQSYIMLLLKDYLDESEISNKQNEFGYSQAIGGIAQKDKISINIKDVEYTNIENEVELNKLLGTIIHEYAHHIRQVDKKYGSMLEESFATIFSELCINNAKLKLNSNNKELFQNITSVNYQKYESQARALLYVLKQHNLDIKMIIEYITGDEEKFKQVCTQILGSNYLNYHNSISSKNNENSENALIELISQYIKNNGLSIADYWNGDKNQVSQNNMYFHGSPTLDKSIVKTGIEYFKPEEQQLYRSSEYSVQIANSNSNFVNEEKRNRILKHIKLNYDIKGKDFDEVYDIIIDLCSSYLQIKSKSDEESKIFIEEITKMIPNIDDFRNKFVSLRIKGQDKYIFNGLNPENITYDAIFYNMNNLLSQEKEEGFSR